MPLSDTSARVDANMSDAQLLVTYLMVPSMQLDLLASPPVMPSLSEAQAGAPHLQFHSSLRAWYLLDSGLDLLGSPPVMLSLIAMRKQVSCVSFSQV